MMRIGEYLSGGLPGYYYGYVDGAALVIITQPFDVPLSDPTNEYESFIGNPRTDIMTTTMARTPLLASLQHDQPDRNSSGFCFAIKRHELKLLLHFKPRPGKWIKMSQSYEDRDR